VAGASAGEYEQGRSLKEEFATKPVRYQEGHLYLHHEAWFVRHREPVRQSDGSIKFRQRAKKLGSVNDYPRESQIKPLFAEFMRQQNAGNILPETCMTLVEFVEKLYLNHTEEKPASTKKCYKEIWNNHIRDRVGHIRMREFRTVDASTRATLKRESVNLEDLCQQAENTRKRKPCPGHPAVGGNLECIPQFCR
jgi:hypothetical protein